MKARVGGGEQGGKAYCVLPCFGSEIIFKSFN